MHIGLKIAIGLAALFFTSMGLIWLLNPAFAAQTLGMPLLEGAGLSTQLGDFASFFIGLGSMMILGLISQNGTYFHCAGLLLFGSALFRTVAWLAYGASFETGSIAVEVIAGSLVLFAANKTSN